MARRILSVLMAFALVLPMLVAQDKKSDDRIYDEVRRRLANDADVKGAALDVEVANGVVTLRGQVHTAKDKEKATSIVKKIKGVVSVDNKLTLLGS